MFGDDLVMHVFEYITIGLRAYTAKIGLKLCPNLAPYFYKASKTPPGISSLASRKQVRHPRPAGILPILNIIDMRFTSTCICQVDGKYI